MCHDLRVGVFTKFLLFPEDVSMGDADLHIESEFNESWWLRLKFSLVYRIVS